MAQAFADCVNRHGGDASVVRFYDIDINRDLCKISQNPLNSY